MCCWEWKPRYFCAWCRMPLFWHPQPGRLEPCLSSRATGGGTITMCVEGQVTPVESECIYKGCCADCARLLATSKVPAHYKDVKFPEKSASYNSSNSNNNMDNNKKDMSKSKTKKKSKKHLRFLKERCVIL